MLKEIITSIIGTYVPVTYETYFEDVAGTTVYNVQTIPDGVAGVDWAYIGALICFAIVLLSVFKIIGAVISWKQ